MTPRCRLRVLSCILAVWMTTLAWAQPVAQPRVVKRDTATFLAPRAGETVLEVAAVRFVDGGWDMVRIEAAFREGASILAQCGVRLTRVQFALLEAPREFQFYTTPVSRALARDLPFPRPTVYFVRDTLNRPAFDAEAIGRANSRTRPELLNTIWVTLGTPDLGIALAHELAHLLMDSGEHSDVPGNLMRAETAAENTHLDAAQCDRLLRSGRQGGLLQ